jgi:hypothetical protein
MKLFEMLAKYRSPKKGDEEGANFRTFLKGQYVEAEYYSPGIKNESAMIIYDNKYIIPLTLVRQLSDVEATKVMGEYQKSKAIGDNIIDQNNLQPKGNGSADKIIAESQEKIDVANKSDDDNTNKIPPAINMNKIKAKATNWAVGAGIGGLAGFFAGRMFKMGIGGSIVLAVATGIAGGAIFNKYQIIKQKQTPTI